jgi:hypothetical protein
LVVGFPESPESPEVGPGNVGTSRGSSGLPLPPAGAGLAGGVGEEDEDGFSLVDIDDLTEKVLKSQKPIIKAKHTANKQNKD